MNGTELMELEGGQKLVRFYDPSGNLIEVRTPINYGIDGEIEKEYWYEHIRKYTLVYMRWIVEWTVVGFGRLPVVHFHNRNVLLFGWIHEIALIKRRGCHVICFDSVASFFGIWFFTGIIDFITYFLFFCILLANILSACEKAGWNKAGYHIRQS